MVRKIKPQGGPKMSKGSMLRQLQSLQENVLKTQEEIAAMRVTASAGGGAVTAVVSGERRVLSLAIKPEVVDPGDVEMLQDLVIAAINEGLERVDQAMVEKMSALTGGLNIPGLM